MTITSPVVSTTTTTTIKETVVSYQSNDKVQSPLCRDEVSSFQLEVTPAAGQGPISWDNPFRPDGDLSKEADTIVELIKEGKPINEENIRARSPVRFTEVQCTTTTANESGGTVLTNDPSIVTQKMTSGPQSAEVVVVKKKKGCCSVA